MLFRGYRVGSVETSHFDPKARKMQYQLFVAAPYDQLVTANVRFWKDSGVALNLSAQGMRVEMGSLSTLLSGGVSFDVPAGWEVGSLSHERDEFQLFDNQNSIQDSLYTEYKEYLLFFDESVRGLQAGAPVEFRGIRLGTVAEVPFFPHNLPQSFDSDYRIPVLVRIEPGRLKQGLRDQINLEQELSKGAISGMRASMKTANLLTGALYVDLDFYPQQKAA